MGPIQLDVEDCTDAGDPLAVETWREDFEIEAAL